MNWTEERVEVLKRLWAEGFSASQIAAQLGGVTRNAVIGKAHRLKLAGRAKAQPRLRKAAPGAAIAGEAAAPKKKEAKAPLSPPPKPAAGRTPVAGGAGGRGRRRFAGSVAVIGATALQMEFEEEAEAAPQLRPQENVVVPMVRRLNLMQLTERTCKWPMGDPLSEDFAFCGADSDESGPYCACHARLAFNSSADKRKN